MKASKPGKHAEKVRFAVLALSIALIGMGVARQEHLEVLQKAVRVCLECIGIG